MASKVRISKSGARQAKAYELFLSTQIRHVANEYHGAPFLLEDWQRKNIWDPVFGQGRMEDGRFKRKVRRLLVGLPRDGGKSEIAVAMLLTIASMEPVHEGEYGFFARNKTQAKKVFGKLKSMILQNPDLHASWEVLTETVVHRETGAKIMVFPYSEAAAQSYHLNVAIVDEYHVHTSPVVLEAVVSGQKNIWNALCIVITTAGPAREGPLWDLIPQWREDPSAHVWWLGASDEDDITDEKTWAKVAIMSWTSIEKIRDQFESTSRKGFERYTMNRFPREKGADKAFKSAQIARAVRQKSEFSFERPFWVGIDGAQGGDAFAIVCVQQNGDKVDAFEYVYDDPPEDTGYYDLVQIEQVIAELYSKHRPLILIDPSRLLLLAQHLEDTYRVPLIGAKQDNNLMCPATSIVVNAVRAGKLRLGGCPKLAEHLSNATSVDREPFGARFGKASKSRNDRIDAAIAIALAMYGMETHPRKKSFAEKGGFYSLPL